MYLLKCFVTGVMLLAGVISLIVVLGTFPVATGATIAVLLITLIIAATNPFGFR